jgi:hypothetical protein
MRVQIAVGALVIAALTGCGSSGSSSTAGQGAAASGAAYSALAASPLGQCMGAVTRLLVQAEAAYAEGYSEGINLNSVIEQYGATSPVTQAFVSLEGSELQTYELYGNSIEVAAVVAQAPQACTQFGA